MGDGPPQPKVPRPALRRVEVIDHPDRKRILGLKRGMIFWGEVTLSHAVGSEQGHDDFLSPWLIISSDRGVNDCGMPVALAVPLTHKFEVVQKYPKARIWIATEQIVHFDFEDRKTAPNKPLEGLGSCFLTEQTRVFSHDRLKGDPVAKLEIAELMRVEAGLRYVLGI